MQRTASANSTSTTSSTTASLKAASRRRKHIANGAAQPLASKTTHATPTSIPAGKLQPKPPATQKHPLPISRLPTKPKTKEPHPCKHCNLILSGAHELQRHTENVHARRKRVWVCRQPTKSAITPLKGLEICKQCKAGKQYNVDYNAAEHLKRGHFSPSRRGRKPKGEMGVVAAVVAKGGSRGPDMKSLKENGWLVEVEVVNEGREVVDEEDEAEVADVEQEDAEGGEIAVGIHDVAVFEQVSCATFAQPIPHATQFLNPIEENICTQVLGLHPNVGFSAFDQDYSLIDNTNADWMAAPMMEHSYSAPGRIPFGH